MNPENIAKIGLVNLEMFQQNSLKNIYNGIRERAAVMRRLYCSDLLCSDCPTAATVSPSTGPFETGDVLVCDADGYPVTMSWLDDSGAVVSTGSQYTIRQPGPFELTCVAEGNFTSPCSASSATISGTSTGTIDIE